MAHESDWLPGSAYDRFRAADFERFVEVARSDPAAPVPTCPGWDVTALSDHLARVYQGRSIVVETGAFAAPDALAHRAEDADPVEWLRRWSDALDRALAGRPDDSPTVTFMPGADTLHFWRRRMALETLVHRTDAEVAAGSATAMDDELSADGVSELLWFGSHPGQPNGDGIAGQSIVALTDGTRRWVVALTDGGYLLSPADAPADVTVSGAAPALLLCVSGRDLDGIGWARFGVQPIAIEGDAAAFARLLARLGAF
jgi:uncharacterized protein (TIGR03083 family)